ncbi:hypothetical protein ACFFQW_04350 [Umezawaea endophytica]|uniref:Uncharacterized protein n=1 Tax=Umezawaea endophytica TaxID=1654476 RepID=A0A9X3AEW4_9PSEU|nr:hypothetical protein [Umezawaea endophytica]MCS7476400.1 hypothetical protein [Umezawaea endophytica]
MELVPQHRALLGVDVVGSAANPGYHLAAVHRTVDDVLDRALASSDIEPSEVLDREMTGDGALLTLPSERLGVLLDLAHDMEDTLAERNRWQKPEVRLRIAVEVGPVGDEPGLYAAKVTLSRLLDSSAFKGIFVRCLEEQGADGANTALIISDHALRTAFSGNHTRTVRQREFTPLSVQDKEYASTAWIRIPGFDAGAATSSPPTPEHRERGRVVNLVNGTMKGIQAETVYGGITFGTAPR